MNRLRYWLRAIVFLALVAMPSSAYGSSPFHEGDSTSGSIFSSRHNLAKTGTIAIAGGTFAYGWFVWWYHDFRPFSFIHESFSTYHLGIDKIGHLFTSHALFRAIRDLWLWGDHPSAEATWWAAGVSVFHALAIEIGDGFSLYGFDPEDLAFNLVGVGYGMLQVEVPFLQNFQLKWSLYYPLNKHAFKINALYDYHIYWMSVKVNELLPESWDKYWPDALQVAVGYSGADHRKRREYIIGLDYNLELIPIEGKDIGLVKKILNLIHLPAPGMKFSPGHKPEFQLLLLN